MIYGPKKSAISISSNRTTAPTNNNASSSNNYILTPQIRRMRKALAKEYEQKHKAALAQEKKNAGIISLHRSYAQAEAFRESIGLTLDLVDELAIEGRFDEYFAALDSLQLGDYSGNIPQVFRADNPDLGSKYQNIFSQQGQLIENLIKHWLVARISGQKDKEALYLDRLGRTFAGALHIEDGVNMARHWLEQQVRYNPLPAYKDITLNGIVPLLKELRLAINSKFDANLFREEYITDSVKFNRVEQLANGYRAAYFWNRGYALVHPDGWDITHFKYDDIQNFGNSGLLFEVKRKKDVLVQSDMSSRIDQKTVYYSGLINQQGHEIVPLIYNEIKQLSDSLAITIISDADNYHKMHGLINLHTGEVLADPKYRSIGEFNYGVAKFGGGFDRLIDYYDISGRRINKFSYISGDEFTSTGVVWVFRNQKARLMDKTGRELPGEYDLTRPFTSEKFIVQRDGKWGVIDLKGNEVIPIEYDDIVADSGKVCRVRKGNTYIYMDDTGKEVTRP